MKIFLDFIVLKLNELFQDKWKDWIFGSGGVVFTLFLIPVVFSTEKPPIVSSLPTSIFLYLFVIAHWANGDKKGAFWASACATIWAVIALQKYYL